MRARYLNNSHRRDGGRFERKIRLIGCPQDLFRSGIAAIGKPYGAVLSDQVHGAFHNESPGLIKCRHLLSGVHQKRKAKILAVAEILMARRILGIDPKDLRVSGCGERRPVAKFAQLLAAAGSLIARIEDENYVFPAQFGQREFEAVLVGERKIGGTGADRKQCGG
jgi:hypothetical protein